MRASGRTRAPAREKKKTALLRSGAGRFGVVWAGGQSMTYSTLAQSGS
nr:MAG TPA: hypothetical protein [Caudoviricetes sp.]